VRPLWVSWVSRHPTILVYLVTCNWLLKLLMNCSVFYACFFYLKMHRNHLAAGLGRPRETERRGGKIGKEGIDGWWIPHFLKHVCTPDGESRTCKVQMKLGVNDVNDVNDYSLHWRYLIWDVFSSTQCQNNSVLCICIRK